MQKIVKTTKVIQKRFISTLQNLERAKNGHCIGIRCGLGQSGVDDGAGGRMVGHGREKPE